MSHRKEMITFKHSPKTKLGKAHKQVKSAEGYEKIGLVEKTAKIKQDVASFKSLVEDQITYTQNELKKTIIGNDFEGLSQVIQTIAQSCQDQIPKLLVELKSADALNFVISHRVALRFIGEITHIDNHFSVRFVDEIQSVKTKAKADDLKMLMHLSMLAIGSTIYNDLLRHLGMYDEITVKYLS